MFWLTLILLSCVIYFLGRYFINYKMIGDSIKQYVQYVNPQIKIPQVIPKIPIKPPYARSSKYHYMYDRYGFPKGDPFYRSYLGDRPYVDNNDPYNKSEKLGSPWAAWGKKWNLDYMKRHGRKYDDMYYHN